MFDTNDDFKFDFDKYLIAPTSESTPRKTMVGAISAGNQDLRQ